MSQRLRIFFCECVQGPAWNLPITVHLRRMIKASLSKGHAVCTLAHTGTNRERASERERERARERESERESERERERARARSQSPGRAHTTHTDTHGRTRTHPHNTTKEDQTRAYIFTHHINIHCANRHQRTQLSHKSIHIPSTATCERRYMRRHAHEQRERERERERERDARTMRTTRRAT